uniref:Sodium/potassium/calcium exchanger 1 n=1 Tax=Mola mola TaxID=94237 RepID=A0A3Q3VRA1_MOLML
MDCVKRKRMLMGRVQFFLPGIFVCTLYPMTISARLNNSWPMTEIVEDFGEVSVKEVAQTTADPTNVLFSTVTPSAPPLSTNTPAPLGKAPHNNGDYPEDLFSLEGRRRGLVTLHIIGMMYMFISFVIVCDQFFVPALLVNKDKLSISDDVAGATFMAAGRSIPKLFALFIGVFVARISVGIGTIVGPAVLCLSWWPLFRDMSFYILDLMMLIISFLDNVIMWWESMMLLTSYTLYVIFMKFDVQIERAFKAQFHKCTMKEPNMVSCPVTSIDNIDSPRTENETERRGEEEKNDKPLSLKWPDTLFKQATYLFLLPVILPLWLTLPDVRNQVKTQTHF